MKRRCLELTAHHPQGWGSRGLPRWDCVPATCTLLSAVLPTSAKEVLFSLAFVCLFVNGIVQNYYSSISQYSAGRRHVDHGRNHEILTIIQITWRYGSVQGRLALLIAVDMSYPCQWVCFTRCQGCNYRPRRPRCAGASRGPLLLGKKKF